MLAPRTLIGLAGAIAALFIGIVLMVRPGSATNQVVVYCAQDQVYAESVFARFEKAHGIKVRPVFDSEAVKTVGLANRLLAERPNPRCDVFWGNEEMRTRQLAAAGVFRQEQPWAAFGHRSRRLVINTNLLSVDSAPRSLLELTNAVWKRKVALAYPQFGTTATHFHALRQLWGERAWEAWCRHLAINEPFLVDGNSVVVKFVGRGEAAIGLTDSDDIYAAQQQGLPLQALEPGPETLLIPNTVAVIRNSPNPQNAQKLFEFLQSREVVDLLINCAALETPMPAGTAANTLQVEWGRLLKELEPVTVLLSQVFLR